jgi:hypothetical protein
MAYPGTKITVLGGQKPRFAGLLRLIFMPFVPDTFNFPQIKKNCLLRSSGGIDYAPVKGGAVVGLPE